jgi:hypothetical protein
MPTLLRIAAFSACGALLFAASPLLAGAQGSVFSNGDRVEGRIGSIWDHCTVIGGRRQTGGYLLRCDGHPDQETVFASPDVRAMQGTDTPKRSTAPPAHAPGDVAAATVDHAFKAIPPRAGVYGCMNQDANEVPTLQFGILDRSTYSTFDGGRGRYVYSARSGVLTFTSGVFKGLRRSRYTEKTFRVLDEHGAETAFVCPWTPKDPRKLHW